MLFGISVEMTLDAKIRPIGSDLPEVINQYFGISEIYDVKVSLGKMWTKTFFYNEYDGIRRALENEF